MDSLEDLSIDLFVCLQVEKFSDQVKKKWICYDTNLDSSPLVEFWKAFCWPSLHGMLMNQDIVL